METRLSLQRTRDYFGVGINQSLYSKPTNMRNQCPIYVQCLLRRGIHTRSIPEDRLRIIWPEVACRPFKGQQPHKLRHYIQNEALCLLNTGFCRV